MNRILGQEDHNGVWYLCWWSLWWPRELLLDLSLKLFSINENYHILSKLSFCCILTCPTNHSMHLEINRKKILVHIFCLRRDHGSWQLSVHIKTNIFQFINQFGTIITIGFYTHFISYMTMISEDFKLLHHFSQFLA